MNKQQSTQLRAADTLLEKGVRVSYSPAPLFLRLFGIRRLHITLQQPTLSGLLRISRLIVGMELTPADFDNMSLVQAYAITAQHTSSALEVLAEAARGRMRIIPRQWYARWLGRHLTPTAFAQAWMVFVQINGVADFTASIRLMLPVNNLSPKEQGSQQADM